MKKIKPVFAHYWLNQWRGGEKVLYYMTRNFPGTVLYTLFSDKKITDNYFSHLRVIHSSFNWSFIRNHHRLLFPFYPLIIRSMKIKENADILISSESGPIKGIKINKKIPHLCYVHSPPRYCYDLKEEYLSSVPIIFRSVLNRLFLSLKSYDQKTVDNVDFFLANSENIRQKIKMFYNRDAEVLYPPIDGRFYKIPFQYPEFRKKKDIYLSMGAVMPYKRIDLLVDAFNKNGKKLVIIGNGSEWKKLKKKAFSNIEFTGYLDDDMVMPYLTRTKAFLFPGEEDFGMTPVEMAAMGIPIIAYGKGGALETVTVNKDYSQSAGVFFPAQNKDSLMKAIEEFEKHENEFQFQFIQNSVLKFHEKYFYKRFIKVIEKVIQLS